MLRKLYFSLFNGKSFAHSYIKNGQLLKPTVTPSLHRLSSSDSKSSSNKSNLDVPKKAVVGYAVSDAAIGRKKVRTIDIVSMKEKGKRIKCLTCYDYTFASILERTNVDIVLVGDSAGHVMQGKSNTLSVTLDHIKYHVECVAGAIKRPLLVADMPFMSFGPSLEVSCANVATLVAAGAEAVKIEGASEVLCKQIEFLVASGVPVMGHIGLQPQAVHSYGGFRIQGKNEKALNRLLQQAKDLENAGCFSMVIELTEPSVAAQITKSVKIPTISIGAGNSCDGNILVIQDMLGMNIGFKPKFLKTFANLEEDIRNAVNRYCEEVDNGTSEPI
ncbi:uncharacterized protein LOC107363601 [Tetranychus urticae]|uniref:3-methyl-2-oxobutanoate hydroxymethyltransferase n=1 Tax=Tetranychus urticae TaxID=32264 RepID=T1KER8_TETUR|nr:uncharacterized protein LOC107363601 [Tetranychus urticae]XP_015786334.1 uncharacterized protein LOC107363601 [Tetranychus urticae]